MPHLTLQETLDTSGPMVPGSGAPYNSFLGVSLCLNLLGSLKRLYESQLGSNDVPVTVGRSGAQSTAQLKMSEEEKLKIVSTLEPSTSFFPSPPHPAPPPTAPQHSYSHKS